MKTITFYSYKGGVGRSLTLSNVAIRLSEFGKKVCIMDFDLEAPGLQFKFKNYYLSKPINLGLVDYISKFSQEGIVAQDMRDYSVDLIPRNNTSASISFIPAGDIDSAQYWKALSGIGWNTLFYEEESQGVNFFLDLKAKIKKEFSPDFLLIDSRTGITDISAITLKILADEVVILSANNEENFFGSKKIIKSLLDVSNSILGSIPKINFVITRLPFANTQKDKEKESSIIESRKKEFKKYLNVATFEILVIRSDRRLEEREQTLIGYDGENELNSGSISTDYLKLFEKLTGEILTPEEKIEFKNKKEAEKEYNKYMLEENNPSSIEHLDRAIQLDSTRPEYFYSRAYLFSLLKDWDKAKEDYNRVVKLDPQNAAAYNNLGLIYINKNDLEKANIYLNKAIEISPTMVDPYLHKYKLFRRRDQKQEAFNLINDYIININSNSDEMLNVRAELYREKGEFKSAYADIYKAIEIDSEQPIYFGTLAEISASDNKIEEFYLNLSIALSRGIKSSSLTSALDVYQRFKQEDRFINLLEKYGVDLDDVFLSEKTSN